MLCDRCHKEEALIHIRGVDAQGNVHTISICAGCAMKSIMSEELSPSDLTELLKSGSLPKPDVMMKLIDNFMRRGEDSEEQEAEARACPNCGLQRDELRRDLLLGCPDCLDCFDAEVRSHLNLKEDFVYTAPEQAESSQETRHEAQKEQAAFRSLNSRLQAAVQAEEYEVAATLKEELESRLREINRLRQVGSESDWGAREIEDQLALPRQTQNNLPWLPKRRDEQGLVRLSSLLFGNYNLSGFELPPFAKNLEQGAEVSALLAAFLRREPIFGEYREYVPAEMEKSARLELTERGWCPQEFVQRKHATRLFVSENERVIALLNDIDHLRVNLWGEAEELPIMLRHLQDFSKNLSSTFDLLSHAKFGRVSRHLNSLGSAMSLGQLMHLPALNYDGRIEALVRACRDMHFNLRPLFRKNEQSGASLYILQSSDSLLPPEQYIERFLELSRSIARNELLCRQVFQSYKENRLIITDNIGRAVGTLRGASLLSFEEAEYLLSTLWLGVEMEMLPWLDIRKVLAKLTELLTLPANIVDRQSNFSDRIQIRRELAASFKKDLLGMEEE